MFRSLPPLQLAVDAVLAVLFSAVAVSSELVGGLGASRVDGMWGIAVALVMTGAVAIRRWSPGLALVPTRLATRVAPVEALAGD